MVRFNHLGISSILQIYRCEPDRVARSVSLGYAITWIMSQRILLHVRGTYPKTSGSGLLTQWSA